MLVRFTSYIELALGADLTADPSSWSWTDVTPYVHQRSGITIQRGRSDWFGQTSPVRCSLTFINNGGRFTPRNPNGAYYGRLQRNTPLRVMFRPDTNSLSDGFGRTSSSSWGSADVGGAWTNTGGAASDFSVSSANGGRHTHTAATSPHYSTLSISVLRSDVRVRVKTAALATGAPLTAAIAVRYVDSSNTNRFELQFNTDQTMTGRLVQRASGSDAVGSTATISGLTHAAGTWYWIRAQSGYTSARLKVWQDGTTEPVTWNIDGSGGFLGNPANGAIGLYSMRETGNTNANATVDFDDMSMVDGPRIQYTGYVDEWPARWADASANQSLAPITCSGVLRRIQQGEVFRSALFRAHTQGYYGSGTAVGYWPCEDSSGATSIASGIGGPPAQIDGSSMQLAGDSTIAGSDPLVVIGTGGSIACLLPAYPAATSWAVRFVMKLDASAQDTLVFITTLGNPLQWRLKLGTGTDVVQIQAFNSAGTEVVGDTGVTLTGIRSKQLYVAVNATQNGTGIDWDYTFTGPDGVGGGKVGTLASSTLGNVTAVHFVAGPAALLNSTIGHIAVSTDTGFGAGSDGATGYAGERTEIRFIRLCAEENVSFIFGDLLNESAATSQMMGPQPTASLINQLREVESTEQGILYDGKQGQLTLFPRSLRYNQSVALSLNVNASTVGWPFEAADDDQALRNDITVSRVGGSNARATQTTGPNAVTAVGVYSDSVTVNTQTDAELIYHASWRRHLGTVEDLRYPQIVLNFARSPSLIDTWCDADIGSRLQITNPPAELPPDTIDLLIEGYTESFDGVSWTAALNCSPALPWQVLELEASGNAGRLDTGGSYLLTSATAGATTLLVATSGYDRTATKPQAAGPQWSTTAEPYDWAIAGERVTATTVNTNAATFVAAGTAAHGDNASVAPTMPAGVQQGDLLLVFAAIRNTSATVSTPSGYSVLMADGNVALFGKIHTGTESAPTVSFTGGSAGDTTSAQMAAFRYTQLVVAYLAAQSNASAQNIAYPSMLPPQSRCVGLWLGWKQDDWTSVATVTNGTEIGEPSTTTGNDQGLVWDYIIQTNAAEQTSGSFVVTGGASAVSKGYVLMLCADVQSCTVTRAVNTVSKAQSANASVSLWRPGVLAL